MLQNKSIDISDINNLVRIFTRSITDAIEGSITETTGLSTSACYAIVQINRAPNCSIEQLRKMLALQHSSVVRLISRLETQGLVVRQKGNNSDLRQVALSLTSEGNAYHESILTSCHNVIERVMTGINEEDKYKLHDGMTKMISNIIKSKDELDVACRLCSSDVCLDEACQIKASVLA